MPSSTNLPVPTIELMVVERAEGTTKVAQGGTGLMSNAAVAIAMAVSSAH